MARPPNTYRYWKRNVGKNQASRRKRDIRKFMKMTRGEYDRFLQRTRVAFATGAIRP